MLEFIASDLPLGIDFAEIGLHILNFAILFVALYLLLYKPVKKFIAKRRDAYRAVEEENKKAAEEAEKIKSEYSVLMEKAREDAVKIAEEAHVKAKLTEAQVLESAKAEADKILDEAKIDAETLKRQAQEEVATSVASLASSLASEILSREIAENDNDNAIEAIISDWKNGGEDENA